MKLLKRFSFALLGVILAVLVAASFLEKVHGSAFAAKHIYGAAWFVALWAAMAVFCTLYLLQRKVQRRVPTFLLHASFIIILVGALITWLSGERGTLHLRNSENISSFMDDDGALQKMPFSVSLKNFHIEYYTGTHAPMDFVSLVSIADNGKTTDGEVSMNHIFTYRSYRFYQSGYDMDGGVTLSVAHDPYGIGVTYAGYALLLLSMLLFFTDKRSHFRQLLKNPLLAKTASVFLLLVCFGANLHAQEPPKVLPREVAAQFGDLYVLYNDRVCPLQTLAKDFTTKLYGAPTYKGFTPEQVFTGWMFYYSSWKTQPMIKIKNDAARNILEIKGKYASLDDFTNEINEYKLQSEIEKIQSGETSANRRGIEEADEKYNLIATFYSGKMLKIFPHRTSEGVEWFSQADLLPEEMENDEWFFVKKSQSYFAELVVRKDFKSVSDLLVKLKTYQQKNAVGALPSDSVFRAEKLYNALHYTRFAAMLCLFVGLLAFVYYCNRMAKNSGVHRAVSISAMVLAAVVFAYLTVVICLRWYVSRHVPLSNGFETMQFMAWCAIGLSLLLRKRFFMAMPFGLLLCGLTMLVSMMGEANPRITQLMPVLASPLLSIHVAVIMIAYALLAFVMLNGITAIVLNFSGSKNAEQIERLQIISQIMLYPAIFCLTAGIFVGAVWANVSWGRYWGWDPKEVWALITMLVYSFALHSSSLPWFRRPMFFHVFAVIAFLSVLITYFGVNYLLGGMHSYA